jgi:hypothetical protein
MTRPAPRGPDLKSIGGECLVHVLPVATCARLQQRATCLPALSRGRHATSYQGSTLRKIWGWTLLMATCRCSCRGLGAALTGAGTCQAWLHATVNGPGTLSHKLIFRNKWGKPHLQPQHHWSVITFALFARCGFHIRHLHEPGFSFVYMMNIGETRLIR